MADAQPDTSQLDASALTAVQNDASAFASQLASDDAAIAQDRQDIKTRQADLVQEEDKVLDVAEKRLQGSQQQFNQPAPQQTNPLNGLVPLVMLSAFGGKVAKMSAGNMLAATNGLISGYMKGNQQQFDQAKDQYQKQYEQWKEHKEQFDKTLAAMEEAYKDRVDYKQKALDQTIKLMGDEVQGKRITLQDKALSDEAAARIIQQTDSLSEQKWYDRAQVKIAQDKVNVEKQKAAAATAPADDDSIKLKAELFMKDPSNTRFSPPERQQIMAYLAKMHVTADDIIQGRASTKVAYAEARSLGNQQAQLERVENALTEPGGVGDQAVQAAQAIDGSKFKQYNRISQILGSQVSDPALARYKLKLLALRDEFAVVINKGAAPTDASRAQAIEVMDQYAPSAVPALVQSIKESAGANRMALQTAIGELGSQGDKRDNQPPSTGPAPGGGAQPVRISGDADFYQLPSGTFFIGPDNVPRVKP